MTQDELMLALVKSNDALLEALNKVETAVKQERARIVWILEGFIPEEPETTADIAVLEVLSEAIGAIENGKTN